MNKKAIKVLVILMLIIGLLFINKSYATNIPLSGLEVYGVSDGIDMSNVQKPINSSNNLLKGILALSEFIQMSLLIISFVLTIIEKIKSKNIKSLSLRIWIILATIFLILNRAIYEVRFGSRGGMIIEYTPEEIIQKNKIVMKNVILLSFSVYAILAIMILMPIKKLKKYKISDKISKGEE